VKFLHYLDQILFGTEEACFSSAYNAQEAATHLSAVILHPSPKFTGSYLTARYILKQNISLPALIGKVSGEKVVIFRHRQGIGRTPFRPIFQGKFVVKDSRTVLKGSFSMALSTKIMTFLWLGFSIYLTLMAINGNQQELQPILFLFPVLSTLIFFLVYGFGRWVSRDDRDFISERIKSSLKDDLDI
jgi:hypothetical protein